jgi:hypothetical protein
MTARHTSAARQHQRNRGSSPPTELRKTLADFDDIAQKRFGTDFETLAVNPDRNRVAFQMRHLVGVALKKQYSDEKPETNSKGELVDYKWKINPAKLEGMPDEAWQIQLLREAPNRLPGETGKQVAARLRRETLLQRCYFTVVHPYLCQTPKVRTEIKSALREVGLGEYFSLATPKTALGVGAVKLYAVLSLTSLPAGWIAVTALALSVIGLNRICRSTGERPKEKLRGRKAQ